LAEVFLAHGELDELAQRGLAAADEGLAVREEELIEP
jgi:hypothetical protein